MEFSDRSLCWITLILTSLDLPDPVVPLIKNRSLGVVFQNVLERTDWYVTQNNCDVMMSLDLGICAS